jgi:hypothetical protein
MLLRSRLYLQALSNISTLMAAKINEILSESSRQVTALSSGSSTTLKPFQTLHIVSHEALTMIKKSLLLSIQVVISPQSMRELL